MAYEAIKGERITNDELGVFADVLEDSDRARFGFVLFDECGEAVGCVHNVETLDKARDKARRAAGM